VRIVKFSFWCLIVVSLSLWLWANKSAKFVILEKQGGTSSSQVRNINTRDQEAKGSSMSSDELESNEKIITHEVKGTFNLQSIENRLRKAPNLILSLEKEIEILHQMTEFELGRFLLANGGINGYWTAYWLIHGPQKKLENPLEDWLINRSPSFTASQERYKIFQREIQSRLRSNMKLASIPCGLMDSLLGLDYTHLENVELIGVDIDQESLILAKENILKYRPNAKVSFLKKSAWHLDTSDSYDLITSNGLNFYEADDRKVVGLYKSFFKALKPGGILVTSFLTPPPGTAQPSPWINFNRDDALMQKAIFVDILQAKWQATRTESLTRQQLEEAGFKNIKFINDKRNIFPTVIAQKE